MAEQYFQNEKKLLTFSEYERSIPNENRFEKKTVLDYWGEKQ